MRLYLLAACLAASAAIASDDPFLSGEALQAEVQKNCSQGCITFNRQEIDSFEQRLERMIGAREVAAYNAGRKYERESCRNAI